MPKHRQESSSGSGSDSDSGPADRNPAPSSKKAKTSSSASSSTLKKNDEGEFVFELSKMRSVTVKDFKGRCYVNLREYYMDKDSGDMRPGRKGIALSVEQWNKLKEHMDDIDKAVKECS